MILNCKLTRFFYATTNPLLKDVRVLDLSRIIVGPYATMILSDFGAEVIKVEHPSGDETRRWGPPWKNGSSCYFISVNRNKKSLTLNLKSPEAVQIVKKLAANSQVLVQNFISGTTQRLGLDYDSICKINTKIVYCSISGYGDSGPKAQTPAFDQVIQGESGFMHITGNKDTQPFKLGFAVSDVLTGLHAATAILGGLQYVNRTGESIHVKTSLLESSVASLINQASNHLNGGLNPMRMGNNHPNIVPYGVYRCKDRFITVAVGNEAQYHAFMNIIGMPLYPQFEGNGKRVQARQAFNQKLQEYLSNWNSDQLLKAMALHKIPSGPINDLESVFKDPQVQHLEMVKTKLCEGRENSEYRLVRSPISTDRKNICEPEVPPVVGEHTNSILSELGYSPEDIQSLRKKQVI